MQHGAIDQHSPAHASAQCQHHDIAPSTRSSPKHLADKSDARIVLSAHREVTDINHFTQRLSFKKAQVARAALHASGFGVDDPFAPNTNSSHRNLGTFFHRVHEIT